jgi:putative ATP-dependent endonuclease of OLD family
MLLDHIEIVGFRGINRLSISVRELTAFLGENSWGKSSLFDALSLFLSGTNKLNKFTLDDFHLPPIEGATRERSVQIVFTFKEQFKGESFQRQFKSIRDAWTEMQDGIRYIYLQIEGEITDLGNVKTRRYFLDSSGNDKAFNHDTLSTLVSEFISFVPVLRMGQSCSTSKIDTVTRKNIDSKRALFETRIQRIFARLTASSQQLSEYDLHQGYEAIAYLFDN